MRERKTVMSAMKYIEHPSAEAEAMTLVEGPIPRVGSDDVLIKVSHFGVNRPDIMQRRGIYPPPPNASPVLGLELAGEIVAMGSDVGQWRVGDKVCALANGGAYAEYCVVPAGQCLPIPSGLSLAEAASLPEVMFTVWSNVFVEARLRPGETLLVHGGASGIGSAAIQMATALGSRVFVTASTQEKCDFCRRLGAAEAINYQQQDFVERVKQLTDGKGVDVILDMVGGDYVPRNFSASAVDGRIVNIAFLRGADVSLNMMPILLKRLTLSGSTLRPRSSEFKAMIASQLREQIWPLIERQRIVPTVTMCLPWQRIADVHSAMEANVLVGKAVLEVTS